LPRHPARNRRAPLRPACPTAAAPAPSSAPPRRARSAPAPACRPSARGSTTAPACARRRSPPRRRGSCRPRAGRPCNRGAECRRRGARPPAGCSRLRCASTSRPSRVKRTMPLTLPSPRRGEGKPFASSSCGKNFSTDSSGFGAAWPRPQIEASCMVCASSVSSAGVPRPRAPSVRRRLLRADAAGRALAAGLVGEEAHGVQRRGARRIVLREHDDRRRADEAAVLLQVSKSSGTSASRAGRMPPEAPPGR
jgi:hypothetical protein